jgi:hypothetical protein
VAKRVVFDKNCGLRDQEKIDVRVVDEHSENDYADHDQVRAFHFEQISDSRSGEKHQNSVHDNRDLDQKLGIVAHVDEGYGHEGLNRLTGEVVCELHSIRANAHAVDESGQISHYANRGLVAHVGKERWGVARVHGGLKGGEYGENVEDDSGYGNDQIDGHEKDFD